MSVADYKKAGKIARDVREWSTSLLKEGAKILSIADSIEAEIIKKGAGIAFPVNLSINDTAAHDTAMYNDPRVLKRGDLLKVDIGVHVNGFIADTAYTREIGSNEYKKLIEASENAVNQATKLVNPGVELREIGRIIKKTINDFGYSPIVNLTGHYLSEWELHAGTTIPNYDNNSTQKIEKGDCFAIEPFATTGEGRIQESKTGEIYSLINPKPTRIGRDILAYIAENYKTLPFARRWLIKKFGPKASLILTMLHKEEIVHNYEVLKEVSQGLVSQAEHTVIITDKEKIITTE